MIGVQGTQGSREAEIPAELAGLDTEIEHLMKVAEELTARLGPVLRSEPQCDEKKEAEAQPGRGCSVAQDLQKYKGQVRGVRNQLRYLHAVLEV